MDRCNPPTIPISTLQLLLMGDKSTKLSNYYALAASWVFISNALRVKKSFETKHLTVISVD